MLVSGQFFYKIQLYTASFLLLLLVTKPTQVSAGNEPDSCYCSTQYIDYHKLCRSGDYDRALIGWNTVVKNCQLSEIYACYDGACIYAGIAETTHDITKRANCIDTLLFLSQKLINGAKDSLLPVNHSISCNDKHHDSLFKAEMPQLSTLFARIVKLAGTKTTASIATTYFDITYNQVCKSQLPVDSLIDAFCLIQNLIDSNLKINHIDSITQLNWAIANRYMNKQLSEMPETSQAQLVLTTRLKKRPSDVDLLHKTILICDALNCTDASVYALAVNNLYKLSPDGETAILMGKNALTHKNFPEAESYYLEAIPKLNDNQRAQACYDLAEVYFEMRRYQEAKAYAIKSIRNTNSDGKAYMLMGKIYVAYAANQISVQKTGCTGYYWAAVDKFAKAKTCDPMLNDQANQYIAMYSMYFPSSEQLILDGLIEGSTFNIGNWLNETTIVRAAP